MCQLRGLRCAPHARDALRKAILSGDEALIAEKQRDWNLTKTAQDEMRANGDTRAADDWRDKRLVVQRFGEDSDAVREYLNENPELPLHKEKITERDAQRIAMRGSRGEMDRMSGNILVSSSALDLLVRGNTALEHRVGCNPAASSDTLDRLARAQVTQNPVITNIAHNPSTSPETLDRLVNGEDKPYTNELGLAVANNVSTSRETLRSMTDGPIRHERGLNSERERLRRAKAEIVVRQTAASNPNLSVADLSEFANSGRPEVRHGVWLNPNTPEAVRAQLSPEDNMPRPTASAEDVATKRRIALARGPF